MIEITFKCGNPYCKHNSIYTKWIYRKSIDDAIILLKSMKYDIIDAWREIKNNIYICQECYEAYEQYHKELSNQEFKECADCIKKPGSPVLCNNCLNNRWFHYIKQKRFEK